MTSRVRVRLHLAQTISVLDNVSVSRLWRFHVDVGRSRCSLLCLTMSISDSDTVCCMVFMSPSVSIIRVRHPWWYMSNTVYMFAIVSDSVHNRSTSSSESDSVCIYVDDESRSCPFTSRTDHTRVGQCPWLPSVTFPRRCWTQSLFIAVFNNVLVRFNYRVLQGFSCLRPFPFSVSAIRDYTRLARCTCLRSFRTVFITVSVQAVHVRVRGGQHPCPCPCPWRICFDVRVRFPVHVTQRPCSCS